MVDTIIAYSVRNKLVVGLFVLALILWGIFSLRQIPIDAVPDITNNQVQVITSSPTLATQEVEQFITTPVELALQNLQNLVEIRSISRFGLSVVTVVFEESTDLYLARQLVSEHLQRSRRKHSQRTRHARDVSYLHRSWRDLPVHCPARNQATKTSFPATELRSIQDWIVRRQLSGIEGVVEVNTLGGFLKQYEVAVNPDLLKSMGVSIDDVFTALENSNENTGGAYIERTRSTFYIRTNGLANSLEDIGNIVVDVRGPAAHPGAGRGGRSFGKAPRYGAARSRRRRSRRWTGNDA